MNDNYWIVGGLLVVAFLFAITDFEPIESTIPPTPAFKSINGTNGNITATKYNDNLELIEGSNISFSFDSILKELTISATGSGGGENNTASNVGLGEGIYKQKTGVDLEFKGIAVSGDLTISSNDTDITISYLDPVGGSGNATTLDNLGDVVITSPANPSILAFDGSQWIDKLFAINNQTATNGNFITGINNQTGVITTQTLKVNTFDIDCTDSQQINRLQYDNTTGIYTGTCETDETGSGTARENIVGLWHIDRTWTNIGATYVNVYATGVGDPIRIDTNGMTTATLIIDWTKVGAGTQSCVIRSTTNPAIEIITFANLVSGLNTNATFDIPTNAENLIDTYKPLCKSTTAGDDPVWLTGQVLLK